MLAADQAAIEGTATGASSEVGNPSAGDRRWKKLPMEHGGPLFILFSILNYNLTPKSTSFILNTVFLKNMLPLIPFPIALVILTFPKPPIAATALMSDGLKV